VQKLIFYAKLILKQRIKKLNVNILDDKMTKRKKERSNNFEKILDALIGNARQPSIELSKKTKLSRQTVQKTIRKLEEEHVVWGYQVIYDEEKKGISNYLILIKRTTKPLDEKLVDKIISRKLEEMASKIGVKVVNSLYCHGIYDWVLSFTATNVRIAKKFAEQIKVMYTDYIAEVHLLETLFFARKQGILNPDLDNLKEFI
jgi:DNA-binding Lrp family transcriptional regulator